MIIYLISFFCTFCHNIFIRAQSALLGYVFKPIFCCQCLRTCYTHYFSYFMGILCNLCVIILLNVFLILLLIKSLHKLINNFNDPFIIHFFFILELSFSYFFLFKSSFFISFMIYSSFSTTMSSL